MIKMIQKMVIKSLMKNIRITAWTLLILTTSATLVSLFATVSFDVEKKMKGALRKLGPNAIATNLNHDETFWSLIKKEGVTAVEQYADIAMAKSVPIVILVAEPQALTEITPYWVILGHRAKAPGECLIGKSAAQALKLKPGMSIGIKSPLDKQNETNFNITGIIVSGDENEDRIIVSTLPPQWIKQGSSFALLSVPGGAEEILRLNTKLNQAKSSAEIKPLREILYGEKTTLRKIILLCSVSLMAVLILTALGVSSALLSRMVERRKELALLRAIGATQKSVMGFLLLEGASLGSIASIAGFIVGTFSSEMVVRQIFHVSVTPRITAFLITFIVTIFVSLLASAIGASRALNMEPAPALRGE